MKTALGVLVIVTFAADSDAAFLLGRPGVRPPTPAIAMACIAATTTLSPGCFATPVWRN